MKLSDALQGVTKVSLDTSQLSLLCGGCTC
jgi:hypothetical protein